MIYNAATGEEKLSNSIVIPKNTPIPCSRTQIYVTSEDNESVIEVDITQGEDADPKFVDIIGRISLEVPPNRPKGCEVAVTFSYDENQRVRALVVDKQSGRSREVAVSYKGAGVLSDEELKRRSNYLKQLRIE
jgi:molecular chaperone DnaK